jgi:hypothetical protein
VPGVDHPTLINTSIWEYFPLTRASVIPNKALICKLLASKQVSARNNLPLELFKYIHTSTSTVYIDRIINCHIRDIKILIIYIYPLYICMFIKGVLIFPIKVFFSRLFFVKSLRIPTPYPRFWCKYAHNGRH